jgi:hypothetical protein
VQLHFVSLWGRKRDPNYNAAAGLIKLKRLADQINVVIHALGILVCLPHLLQPGEVIDYVSLAAGNNWQAFDPGTNRRIVEFKFIAGTVSRSNSSERWRRISRPHREWWRG